MEASTPTPSPSSTDPVAKSNKTVMIILGSILLVVVLGIVVYFVTRTSEQDKALQAVCTARQDIKTRIDRLASTNVANFTLNGFKADVNGIAEDLQTIKANQDKLEPNRKQQIQTANSQFGSAVTSTLKSLGTSLSLENAQSKLTQAGKQLVNSYQQSLEPIDCSGVDTGSN